MIPKDSFSVRYEKNKHVEFVEFAKLKSFAFSQMAVRLWFFGTFEIKTCWT